MPELQPEFPPHVIPVFIRVVPPCPLGGMIDRLSDEQVLGIVGGE